MVSVRLISQGSRLDRYTHRHSPGPRDETTSQCLWDKKWTVWHDPAWELTVNFLVLVFQEHFLPLVLCSNHLYFAWKKTNMFSRFCVVSFAVCSIDLSMLAPSKPHDLGHSVHEEISLHHAGFAVPEMVLSCTFSMHFPQILSLNNIPLLYFHSVVFPHFVLSLYYIQQHTHTKRNEKKNFFLIWMALAENPFPGHSALSVAGP